jgi:hypothetical protein
MGKQRSIFTKQFNPYDLNDVAEINNTERQYPIQRPCQDNDKEKIDKDKGNRGLLKLQDEEKK